MSFGDLTLTSVTLSFMHCTKNEVFHYRFFQETEDLITFTDEILQCEKLQFLWSDEDIKLHLSTRLALLLKAVFLT